MTLSVLQDACFVCTDRMLYKTLVFCIFPVGFASGLGDSSL